MAFEAATTPSPSLPETPAAETGNPGRTLFLLGALPLVAILIFAMGLAFGARRTDVPMLGIAIVTMLLACVPLILDQSRPPSRRHVFIALLALIYMIHYVAPVFTAYLPATGPVEAPGMAYSDLYPRDVVRGQLVALAGLVTLLVAYALPTGRGLANLLPQPRFDWSPDTTFIVALGMIAVGWTITLGSIAGVVPTGIGTGVISTIASSYYFSNVPLTMLILRHRHRLAVPVLAVNVALAILLGFFTSRKIQMVVAPAIIVLTSMILRGRIRLRWFVAGLVVMALIYPISVFVREDLQAKDRTFQLIMNPVNTFTQVGDFVSSGRPGQYFAQGLESLGARLDGLGVTSVLVRDTPSISPYQNGRTLWLFVIAFVPRALWPDKPSIQIGPWITAIYGSGPHIESSTGPTQIGEFYINFGLAGVIGGMMVLGLFLRIAFETLFRRVTVPGVLAQVVIVYWLVVRFEASIAGLWSGMVFALAPIVLAHYALRLIVPLPRIDEQAAAETPPSERGWGEAQPG